MDKISSIERQRHRLIRGLHFPNLIFFFIILICVFCYPVDWAFCQISSLPPSIAKNIVQIETTFSDGSSEVGNGVVLCEVSEALYIVSAVDVVIHYESDDIIAEEVKVTFSDGIIRTDVSDVTYNYSLSIVAFRVGKPETYQWDHSLRGSYVYEDAEVCVPERIGEPDEEQPCILGRVSIIREIEIEARFNRDLDMEIGGPLVSGDAIAGIVVSEEHGTIKAVKMDKVTEVVTKWINVDIASRQAFPFLHFCLEGGIIIPGSYSALKHHILDWKYGLHVLCAFSRFVSFRFALNSNYLRSNHIQFNANNVQFGHKFTSYSFSMQFFKPDPLLFRDDIYWYLGVGCSYQKIDPKVRFDYGQWTSLSDVEGANHKYNEEVYAYNIFGGFHGYGSPHVVIGFEVGFSFYDSRYIFIDLDKLYEGESANDWMVSITFNVGYAIRSTKPKQRIIH